MLRVWESKSVKANEQATKRRLAQLESLSARCRLCLCALPHATACHACKTLAVLMQFAAPASPRSHQLILVFILPNGGLK